MFVCITHEFFAFFTIFAFTVFSAEVFTCNFTFDHTFVPSKVIVILFFDVFLAFLTFTFFVTFFTSLFVFLFDAPAAGLAAGFSVLSSFSDFLSIAEPVAGFTLSSSCFLSIAEPVAGFTLVLLCLVSQLP